MLHDHLLGGLKRSTMPLARQVAAGIKFADTALFARLRLNL